MWFGGAHVCIHHLTTVDAVTSSPASVPDRESLAPKIGVAKAKPGNKSGHKLPVAFEKVNVYEGCSGSFN